MTVYKFCFVIFFSITYQNNGNICRIKGCQQNSPSDILQENLTLTTKLPRCIMATNYDGLSFSVVLENNVYQSCSWIFATTNFLDSNRNCVDYNRTTIYGTSYFSQENIFTSFAPCTNRSSSHQGVREITCVMNNGKYYSSIVFKSIANDYFVSVQCDATYSEGFYIKVRPCNTTFGQQQNQVYVDSKLADYNAAGSFQCNKNGTLFYSDGTLLQDNSTRCLATAEWKGQKDLQCWEAPSVRLIGNYDWVNGSRIFLQCEYNDGFPIENKSIFYVNNTVSAILSKGETFRLTVDRTYANLPVYCQAQTRFTQTFYNTGCSGVYLLNVLFAPYLLLQRPCVWNLNANESCKIEFLSHPNATFVSLTKDGIDITNSSNFSFFQFDNNLHVFTLNVQKSVENNSGIYNLTVHSMLRPYFHHILFEIMVTRLTSATTTTTPMTFIGLSPIAIIVVGAPLGIFLFVSLIVSVALIYKK